MFRKIGNRIITSFIVLISALIVMLLFLVMDHIREYHYSVIKREMTVKIDFIELEIRNYPQRYLGGTIPERENHIKELSRIINLRITLVDFNGRVIADSKYEQVDKMDSHRYRVEVKEALAKGMGEGIRYSSTLGTDMLYLAKKRTVRSYGLPSRCVKSTKASRACAGIFSRQARWRCCSPRWSSS